MGHEGPGSILEKLKVEGLLKSSIFWNSNILGLATELYIYDRHNEIATRVKLNIRLTEKGFERWEYVYQTVFAYIQILSEMSSGMGKY